MIGLYLTTSIITLNINSPNIPQLKEIRLDLKKSKIQLYAAYKKCTFNTKTQIG